jgi:hypothetical protein
MICHFCFVTEGQGPNRDGIPHFLYGDIEKLHELFPTLPMLYLDYGKNIRTIGQEEAEMLYLALVSYWSTHDLPEDYYIADESAGIELQSDLPSLFADLISYLASTWCIIMHAQHEAVLGKWAAIKEKRQHALEAAKNEAVAIFDTLPGFEPPTDEAKASLLANKRNEYLARRRKYTSHPDMEIQRSKAYRLNTYRILIIGILLDKKEAAKPGDVLRNLLATEKHVYPYELWCAFDIIAKYLGIDMPGPSGAEPEASALVLDTTEKV